MAKTIVTYNGSKIASLEQGQTAILKCANNELEHDIVISAKADEGGYLTFSSPSSFTLSVADNKKYWDGTLEYSTDTDDWSVWNGTDVLTADEGKLYLRGTNNTLITGENVGLSKGVWKLDGSNISISGNIENLLDYKTVANGNHPTMADHAFYALFAHPESSPNQSITNIQGISFSTMLANYCYSYLFSHCEGFTTAPSLPAMTLAEGCYQGMFAYCKNLTTAPSLPATTLAYACYANMFKECDNLTTAPPSLPAMTAAERCCYGMFLNCKNLITAPSLPAMTLATECYFYMFAYCESLTTAPPSLPATTLAESCCYGMFWGCKNLTTAPSLPAMEMAKECYASMFMACENLTTAPSLPAMTLAEGCYSNMFSHCKNLITIPKLPAIKLESTCYSHLFHNCAKIRLSSTKTSEYATAYRIPESGTGTTASYALESMFEETGGTFVGTPSINTTYYTSNEVVYEVENPDIPSNYGKITYNQDRSILVS